MSVVAPVIVGGAAAATTTVSLTTLVTRARQKFLNDEPWEDTSSAAQDGSEVTITMTNPTKWNPNDIMEAFTDGELERIMSQTSPLANPITVKRGHDSTTAVAHASGAVFLKNPRFRYSVIYKALENVATNETWPYLWVVSPMTITPSLTTELYAITDAAYRNPIGAVQQGLGTITNVVQLPPVEVVNVPTSISSTSKAVRMRWFDNLTNAVTFYYQAQITATTIPDGDVAEYILAKASARVLRYKAVELSGRDTNVENQKSSIAEMVGEAENLNNQAEVIKKRANINLIDQFYPQTMHRWA